MPVTAAIDNETLDHLLSVVERCLRLRGIRALSKRRASVPGSPRFCGASAQSGGSMRVGLRHASLASTRAVDRDVSHAVFLACIGKILFAVRSVKQRSPSINAATKNLSSNEWFGEMVAKRPPHASRAQGRTQEQTATARR